MIVRFAELILCFIALLVPARMRAAEMRDRSVLFLDQPETGGQLNHKTFVSLRSVLTGYINESTREIFEPISARAPARTIVRAHEGWLRAENQAGGDAVFRLSLPLSISWEASS